MYTVDPVSSSANFSDSRYVEKPIPVMLSLCVSVTTGVTIVVDLASTTLIELSICSEKGVRLAQKMHVARL